MGDWIVFHKIYWNPGKGMLQEADRLSELYNGTMVYRVQAVCHIIVEVMLCNLPKMVALLLIQDMLWVDFSAL